MAGRLVLSKNQSRLHLLNDKLIPVTDSRESPTLRVVAKVCQPRRSPHESFACGVHDTAAVWKQTAGHRP
ncbi:hypothetical protein L596_006224 [Steinernema carpocapsae]|uniref:Uncharacterized protein n=1 Tax=Steinernema carpocapsae TaxID=34508 RepID=A0A4V6I8Q5_STECR|nr:hypothetical protein L596_006224 [Steinernema carpocapsae]